MNLTATLQARAAACVQLAQTMARQGNLAEARKYKAEALKCLNLAEISAKIEQNEGEG